MRIFYSCLVFMLTALSFQLSGRDKACLVSSVSDKACLVSTVHPSFLDPDVTCLTQDSLQLVSLYNATNGAAWTNTWDLTTPVSTWYGVTLTVDGCGVYQINLKNNNLVGTLPLLNMPNLQFVDLSNNQISGSIPNFSLPKLSSLVLNNNLLSGSIPNFNAVKLLNLNLSSNQLAGTIPNFLTPDMTSLVLNNNQLSGNVPNFNMPSLVTLVLSSNQLSGNVPNFNMPNLLNLAIDNNQFSGILPNFASIIKPNYFHLENNNFVFGDIFGNALIFVSDIKYAPQAKIPLTYSTGLLSVATGRPDGEQTFTWYKDNVVIPNVNSSKYKPAVAGTYRCVVSHNTLTVTNDNFRNLILTSQDLAVACDVPTITSPVSPAIQCVGNTVTLTASATSLFGLSVKVQRKGSNDVDYVDIGTASAYTNNTVVSYTTPALAVSDNGVLYRAVFISSCNGGLFYSNAATINVSNIALGSTSATNVSCNGGNDGTVTVTATGGTSPIVFAITPNVGTQNNGAFTALTANNYSITATDASGCKVTTNAVVSTVADVTKPVVTCPVSLTVNTDANACSAVVNYSVTATDNCTTSPSITQTAGLASGSPFNLGVTTNTFTATDAATNISTPCSFTVTVQDVQKPSFTSCPTDITVSNDLGKCSAVVTFAAPTATDNCTALPTIAQTAGSASGAAFNGGITTNTFTATDASNNATTCSFKVTVNDTEKPTITCPSDITVNNTASQCGAIVNFTAVKAIDNCTGTPTISQTGGVASGAFFNVGITTNAFIATDAAGNSSTCSFKVNVIDIQTPVITCPSDITINTEAGKCGAKATFNVTATDNCTPVISQLAGLASGSTFPLGTTLNTFKASDAALNASTCSFNVIVIDNEKPVITCPADISVNNEAGKCSAVVSFAVTATDNCSQTISQTAGLASSSAFTTGTTINTFKATDAAGNFSSCSFNVIVKDNEKPVVTCPANVTVSNDAGSCNAIVTYAAVTATDNCTASPTIALKGGSASGVTFALGTSTNTFSATDAAGNVSTCSFTVTVKDTELPKITCPSDITINTIANTCGATVSYNVTASDNCSQTTVQTAGLASGSTFNLGSTTNTFTATDASNNSSTCSFKVIVFDFEKPVIKCPADITVNNDPSQCGAKFSYNVTATDNCSATITQTAGAASGSFFLNGTTLNTFVAKDASNNSATCSFYLTVIDNEKPSFTNCPVDVTVNNDAGNCSTVVTYNNITATDNCTTSNLIVISQTAGLTSGSTFNLGTTTNTFTAKDASNNTATCSFKVTVKDSEKPVFTNCPIDVTINNDLGKCSAVFNYNTLAASDNCTTAQNITIAQTAGLASGSTFNAGSTTNAFTATDAAGNVASCSFKITVQDAENPTVTCPANISVNNNAGVCGAKVTFNVTAGDNCGATVSKTAGLSSGELFPVGITTNTFIATDLAGNVSTSCSFTVTVTDNEAPKITCPSTLNVNTDKGVCGAVVNFAVTATDNCVATPLITQTDVTGLSNGSTFPVGTTSLSYKATDGFNNASTCSFNVVVSDNEKPVITCPADITINNEANKCGATVVYTISATDNCTVFTNETAGSASGAFFPIGTTLNTYSATDASNNTSTCSFNVTVIDNEKVAVTSPTVSNTLCLRTALTLKAVAVSTRTLTVKWQRKGRTDATFSDVTTAAAYNSGDTSKYNFASLANVDSAAQYRAVFSTSCGDIFTNTVTLTIFECFDNTGLRPFPDGIKECLKTPFRVLEKFYNATNGTNWVNKTNWFTEKDLSKWYGITLTPDGCDILGINLSKNNLVDALPTGLGGILNTPVLQSLVTFDLSGNALTGTIPNYGFPSLVTFNLNSNSLTGSVPNFNLPNLQTLSLFSNKLSGSIPNFNLPALQTLSLATNQLNGSVPNFSLPALKTLDLSNNALTGSVPDLAQSPQLTTISLGTNQLSGTIPNFGLTQLQVLNLSVNQLTGSIPNFSLANLQSLTLYSNKLSGSIPNFNLPNLQTLSLSINQLTGSMPNFNLPFLKVIDVSVNQLTGSVPNLQNSTSLESVNVSNNQLSGAVPNLNIQALNYFQLDGNKFVFSDILGKNWLNVRSVKYAPQSKIPLVYANGVLTVTTGSPNSEQSFKWYKDNVLIASAPNSNQYTPIAPGTYRCEITHNVLTIASNPDKNLVLVTQDNFANVPLSDGGRPLPFTLKACLIPAFNQLEKIYDATAGANWTNKSNWFSADLSTWFGVTLTADGCDVAGVNLSNNNLKGTLPTLTLANLQTLNLSTNQLTGNIPALSGVKALTDLNLSKNQLNGSLPDVSAQTALVNFNLSNNQLTGSIADLTTNTALQILNLSNNKLSGSLPALTANTALTDLNLAFNQLTGSSPNFNFPNLVNFNLSNNQLSGSIPAYVFTKLLTIDLSKNAFSGSVPAANLPIVQYIDLSNNQLSGNIPDFSVGSTTFLSFSNNKFIFGDIIGKQWLSVPTLNYAPQAKIRANLANGILSVNTGTPDASQTFKWFKDGVEIANTNSSSFKPTATGTYYCQATHSILTVAANSGKNLVLQSQDVAIKFTAGGRLIPLDLPLCLEDDFKQLEVLYDSTGGTNWVAKTNWFAVADMNTWSGITLTADGCDIATISLSSNNLTGIIPILNLPSLTLLDLSKNKLTSARIGSILPKLTDINLSNNQLIGSIINYNIPTLTRLNLSNNSLSGEIPNFSQFSLTSLVLNNNQFSGAIPNFNLPNLTTLQLNNNQLSGGIPNFSLPKLTNLQLNSNLLTNGIPNFSLANLQTLFLNDNKLSGNIPNFNLPNLMMLNIGTNQLSGVVPTFSFSTQLSTLSLENNAFIFGDLANLVQTRTIATLSYAPQAKISISFANDSLRVATGEADNVQQFKWYKDGNLVATTNTSKYKPTVNGIYNCKITHNTLTVTTDVNRNLELQTENFEVSLFNVVFSSFTGKKGDTFNQLDWSTTLEVISDSFVVERSKDSITFAPIGAIKAAGNSSASLAYQFKDASPIIGTNYYRIKAKDATGKFVYSIIIKISFNTPTIDVNTDNILSVFPNPAKDAISIKYQSYGITNQSYFISNVIGQIVQSGLLKDGDRLNISDLSSGIYFLHAGNNAVKFVKE